MKRLLVVLSLVLIGAAASAQPNLPYNCVRDVERRPVFCTGIQPTVTAEMGIPIGTPFFSTSDYAIYYWSGSAWTSALASATLSNPTITGTVTNTGGLTFTAQVLLADGSAAAPPLSFSANPAQGLLRGNNNTLYLSPSSDGLTSDFAFYATGTAGGLAIPTTGSYVSFNADLHLQREAAATLQLGADVNGAAVAQAIKSHDGITGSNVAGADLTIAAGRGTGTGAPGQLVFSTASTLTTGTTAQSLTERARISELGFRASTLTYPLTADAVVQVGQTVMPDAGTALRFDVNTGSGTGAIGVYTGTGAAAQGTSYSVVFGGTTRVAIAEDQDVALGEYLTQSATAGYCDAAAISTIGLNIGRVLETAPVTNTINPTGCTGGSGCINTALDTPNSGPAGQITLAADVVAQGWAVGDPVIYWNSGGATPTGLTDGGVYFIVSVATTNVTIAATKGGAVVVPTTQGDDATQYLQRLPLSVVHVY